VLPDWSDDPTDLTGKIDLFECLVVGASATNFCGTTGQLQNQSLYAVPGPSPDGGNFVAIDGDNAQYSNPLTQTLTLPSTGTYTVSFYQAAAQLIPKSGATTELWDVCLGSECIDSTEMFNASESDVPWMSQSLTFNATSTTEVLSFLAVGSVGLPPFVLLDGVSVTPTGTTPEPAAYTLVGIGLVAFPIVRRLLKKKRSS
jgi:hypothetical protein